jgi:hypothetical protein
MSQHHGKPALHRKCAHCKRPFTVWVCHAKRSVARFCCRSCYFIALRRFLARYDGDDYRELSEAA